MAKKYDLVEEVPDEFMCPVNFDLLVAAKQTSCCGKHLSEGVSDRLEANNKPCPMCNTPNLNTHKDLYFRRLVGQVKVYCEKKSQGCKWVGEVSVLDKHLNYNFTDGDCEYVKVACPYFCRQHVARIKLSAHMTNNCLKRPFNCNYCDEVGSYDSIVNSHLPSCEKFPVDCPRKCGDMLRRNEISAHMENDCPLRMIACEFTYAGCKSVLRKKDLVTHMEDDSDTHLSLLASYCKRKDTEIEALKTQVQTLTNIVTRKVPTSHSTVALNSRDIGFIRPPIQIMTRFSEYRSNNEKWKSTDFYSHIGGYKMCILVVLLVHGSGNEFVGVYIQMLRGEYDNALKWPFHGSVVVRMLNQLGDDNHVEKAILDASSYSDDKFHVNMVSRVTAIDATSCWGCSNFASVKILDEKVKPGTQYLKNDTLKFEIVSVGIY